MKHNIQIDNLVNQKQFLGKVAEFWCLEWGSDKSEEGIAKKKEKIEQGLRSDGLPVVLVAFEKDRCVGTIAIVEDDLAKRPDLTPWIASVYVDKDFRGHGIARLLIESAVRKAKGLGIKKIYLHTETAHGLYEKMGWKYLCDTTNDKNEATTVYFNNMV
jgi:GNAT superfamily N-acetyltransferase